MFYFYKEKHRNNAGFGVSQTPILKYEYEVKGYDMEVADVTDAQLSEIYSFMNTNVPIIRQ